MPYKLKLLAILVFAAIAAATGIVVAQPRGAAGECGEFRYWHDGECTDARDKQAANTWAEEMLAKHWKP